MPTQFTFGQSFAQGFADAKNRNQQAQQFALQQVLDFAKLEESKRSSRVFEGQKDTQLSLSETIEQRLQSLLELQTPGIVASGELKQQEVEIGKARENFFSGTQVGLGALGNFSSDTLRFAPEVLQTLMSLRGQDLQKAIAELRELGANKRQKTGLEFGFGSSLVGPMLEPFFNPNFGRNQSILDSQIFRNFSTGSGGGITMSPEEKARLLKEFRNQ